ncbi:histone-fold-containing protein [Ascobolus immersus RN42]|uniref:Histone-fold-containing protein n=1 Tax=Ascobolus immersus RN42 TaxID=1160509 RepID=A0A3N4IRL8_ASCIM|nr:histone-fold-containing protein [Ascobolus immersus RN42]
MAEKDAEMQVEKPAEKVVGDEEERTLEHGYSVMPLGRVKKIIKLDDDVKACSNAAAFVVAGATELFVKYLAAHGMKGAKQDKRKTLQYRDLSNAVARNDSLEFLSDIVPQTLPYKKIVEKRKKDQEDRETGQLTLREQRPIKKAGKTNGHVANGRVGKSTGSGAASTTTSAVGTPEPSVDDAEPKSSAAPEDEDGDDVEMAG